MKNETNPHPFCCSFFLLIFYTCSTLKTNYHYPSILMKQNTFFLYQVIFEVSKGLNFSQWKPKYNCFHHNHVIMIYDQRKFLQWNDLSALCKKCMAKEGEKKLMKNKWIKNNNLLSTKSSHTFIAMMRVCKRDCDGQENHNQTHHTGLTHGDFKRLLSGYFFSTSTLNSPDLMPGT